MAAFCTKCGATLAADTQFCTACGTPVVAAAAAPATSFQPVAQQPYQQGYSAPQQPAAGAYYPPAPVQQEPQKSGGALKIILIIVGVIVLLGIIGVSIFGFTVWRIAHAVHVNGPNGEVTINTPQGSISTNTTANYSAGDLGIDIYPGATATAGGMRVDTPNEFMHSGIFATPDSKDQIMAYYKAKMGGEVVTMDMGTVAILTLKKGENEAIQVTISNQEKDADGKTKFTILHTKKNK